MLGRAGSVMKDWSDDYIMKPRPRLMWAELRQRRVVLAVLLLRRQSSSDLDLPTSS